MGRTGADKLRDALENERTYGSTNGVCVESEARGKLSRAVSGIWDQHQDRLQVAKAVGLVWSGGKGRALAPAPEPCRSTGRGSGVRDGAAQAGPSALGPAQDPGVVSAAARHGGFGEQFQTDLGAGGPDRTAPTPATGR